jgi:hypothetical protein
MMDHWIVISSFFLYCTYLMYGSKGFVGNPFFLCNFSHGVSKSHLIAYSGYTDEATTHGI